MSAESVSPTARRDAPVTEELALLQVLVDSVGRVIARRELARRIGVADRSERRCDSLIVELRRHLGNDAIVTVRSRGWMLEPAALADAHRLLGTADS